jgi:hypothetical protein
MSEPAIVITPVDTVLQRVASELGTAASEIADLEARLAGLIGSGHGDVAEIEQLQALDRLGQQLRVLELFLYSAAPRSTGRVDLAPALEYVWLEGVRARLSGVAAAPAAGCDAELW